MKRYRFTFAQRLHGKTTFSALFQQGQRKNCGPFVVIAVPNESGFCRLGLSVSRKVGNSVKRHHIKRLLREAFRLVQHEFPGAYDLIIVIRPHTVWELAEYQKTLLHAVGKLHRRWEKLQQQDQRDDSQGPPGM